MMERPSAAARSRPKEQTEQPQQPIKKKSAEEAVAELEQRLAALGGPSPVFEEEPVTRDVPLTVPPPTAAPPAPTGRPPSVEQPAAAQVKVGKNALLVSYFNFLHVCKVLCSTPVLCIIEILSCSIE